MQKGHLFSRSGAWYVRYYEKNGREVIRRAKHLGYLKHYPTQASIEPVLDAFMSSINVITLDEFIEFRYLPYAKELRPSTHQGYLDLWKARIKGLSEAKLRVREYHPVDVQAVLNAIAGRKLLARSTLSHIKGFLSGCFRYAVFSGVRDTNPVRECKIPRGGKPPRKTHAYTLAEIQKILLVLDGGLKALVATAAFTGLRLSELMALEWADYDGRDLHINRNVWRSHVSDPKSSASKDYVPVIPTLRMILDDWRSSSYKEPSTRMFTPADHAHTPIVQALKGTGIEWKGWHEFRRGLATNLAELGVGPKVIQRVMRHSKLDVTYDHYIKARDEKVDEAMEKLNVAIGSKIYHA